MPEAEKAVGTLLPIIEPPQVSYQSVSKDVHTMSKPDYNIYVHVQFYLPGRVNAVSANAPSTSGSNMA